MKLIFEQESIDGVILVDASNAFNSLNKRCTHYTTSESYAPNFRLPINTYRLSVRMFIQGGGKILSVEGTTQGDNLAISLSR